MKETFLYETIANQLQSLIENGVIKVGDKLTSVRQLSKEKKVSLTTAFKAYEELIYRGWVESRPKSGYFVKSTVPLLPDVSYSESRLDNFEENNVSVIHLMKKIFSNEDLIKLSITSPDIDLLPSEKLNKSMREVLQTSPDSCLGYGNAAGNIELRRLICRYLFGPNGYAHQDEVIVTQGCIEALAMSLMTVTKPGDTILIERPAYYSVFHIIKNLNLKVIETEIDPLSGPDLTHIEECLRSEKISAILLTPNFNNPTGSLMSDSDKENLVKMVTKYEVPLIEDDVSGEIYFGLNRPNTCKHYDKEGWVLYCSSFSKILAPGYRIGWCLPGKFKEPFMEIKLMHTVATASPTQAAIAQFLQTGRYDLYIRRFRRTLQIQYMQYSDAISKHFPPGTRMTKPNGGFVIWIELPNGSSGIKLSYEALKKGISIFPGTIFCASGGFENFIRVSFGKIFDKTIEESIATLGTLITSLNSTSRNQ